MPKCSSLILQSTCSFITWSTLSVQFWIMYVFSFSLSMCECSNVWECWDQEINTKFMCDSLKHVRLCKYAYMRKLVDRRKKSKCVCEKTVWVSMNAWEMTVWEWDSGVRHRTAAELQDWNESLLPVKISVLFWKVAKGRYGVKSVPSLPI